mmetsp:Transcript_86451/g.245125  ORF Transcript_86451/g.245125 Transcript_86451/m.245125 type:complete len:533 (+) Transcript_86451:53-1651(+)
MTGGRCMARRRATPLAGALVLAVAVCLCLYGAVLGPGAAKHAGAHEAIHTAGEVRRLSNGASMDCNGGVCTSADTKTDIDNMHPSLLEALLNAFGLFYMFLSLYFVCDEFFVPALDAISNRLELSPDVAGATFMAAGGSAPEFSTSLIGALKPTPSNVGIAAIVGSAVFNVLAVIGACGLAAHVDLNLTWYPLVRDSLFYIIDLLVIAYAFSDGEITMVEAAVLFALYVVYCIFMSFSGRVEAFLGAKKEDKKAFKRFKELDANHDGQIDRDEANADDDIRRSFNQIDTDKSGKISFQELRDWKITCRRNQAPKASPVADSEAAAAESSPEEPDGPMTLCELPYGEGCHMWAWFFITWPIKAVLICTVPDVRRDCFRYCYVPGFFLSIAWVVVFSYFMVQFTEVVGKFTGIPTVILAVTLLAWGTSIPDLLTSVLVTLQGHGDMAVSSSIGSNIFDVTVGLPVPWMVYLTMFGGTFPVGSEGMFGNIIMLMGMLAFTIGSIMLNGWILNWKLGLMLLVLWVGFTVYSIVMLF